MFQSPLPRFKKRYAGECYECSLGAVVTRSGIILLILVFSVVVVVSWFNQGQISGRWVRRTGCLFGPIVRSRSAAAHGAPPYGLAAVLVPSPTGKLRACVHIPSLLVYFIPWRSERFDLFVFLLFSCFLSPILLTCAVSCDAHVRINSTCTTHTATALRTHWRTGARSTR